MTSLKFGCKKNENGLGGDWGSDVFHLELADNYRKLRLKNRLRFPCLVCGLFLFLITRRRKQSHQQQKKQRHSDNL